ncbi:leucine-rich repeat-containing protein 14 isoform X2 [Mus musculus]|nr:leucine-rich repeat-containing protein 14 isoform X2 [Mus musculus]XP_030104351.1 leucine-rich repeat-containing protein 14 isoform X2 [Mus musculus]XP_036015239.1 leucine-rich repeat-containing protein 14 isoform X2 [Mus musculus]|eukprot:XP_017172049.1 PREDICTED: leucine-rich repeat-containing protein 14 isoform X2 [Mus musculus]
MHTLVFLSTRQVLQCQPAACQALPLLPRELFPLLFKVAFMDKKTLVLRELVHTWPFPLLSFQQLLQECAHCSRALLQERLSTESMQAVILGLTARIHTQETEAGTQPLCSTLQRPLESLELAFCALLPEDLRFLAQSSHAAHLKKLDLSGNDLSGNQLTPFQGLLQAVATTLLHLELTECQLADAQLLATLPTLTRCASLRYLGLYGNPLSMAGLKELLRDSVVQAELRTVVHPFPVDCYEGLPWPPPASVLLEASINEEKFARVEAELHQLLLASGRAHVLWTTDIYGRLAADYFSL